MGIYHKSLCLCVFVAWCEEIERRSFPTRSGYGLDHVVVAEDL